MRTRAAPWLPLLRVTSRNRLEAVVRTLGLRGYLGTSSMLSASNVGMAGMGFLQAIIASRSMGPALFGVWSVLLASVSISQALVGARTTDALNRSLTEARTGAGSEDVSLLLGSALYVDILTALVAALLTVAGVHLVYGDLVAAHALSMTLIVLCAYPLFSASLHKVWYAVTRDARQFAMLAFLPFSVSIVRLALIAAIAFTGELAVSDIVWVYASVAIGTFLVQVVHLRIAIRSRWDTRIRLPGILAVISRRRELSEFWKTMGTLYVRTSISSVMKHADVLTLGVFRPESEVGLYRVARSIASLLLSVGQGLNQAMFQDAAELAGAGEMERLRILVRRVTLVLLPPVALLAVACILFAPELMSILYGQAYVAAAIPFTILVAGTGVALLLLWTDPLCIVLGKLRQQLIVTAVVTVGMFALLLYLVPRYGMIGTAISQGAAWVFLVVGMLLVVWPALSTENDRANPRSTR